jgi:hypothetical protein
MLSTSVQARALELARFAGGARLLASGLGAWHEASPLTADALAGDLGSTVLALLDPDDSQLAAASGALSCCAGLVTGFSGAAPEEVAARLEACGCEHGSVDAVVGGVIATLFGDAAAADEFASRGPDSRPWRALAIMPVFNEADVIGAAIGDLIAQGCDVYLIDHGSTDGTVAAAEPYLGRGLVHIERFPEDAGFPERNRHEMVWRDILRRVEQVAAERVADWYLFVNADEFREAPWPGVSLADGLRRVDELGYNAVNFALFNFRPVDESFVPGSDVRESLTLYESGESFDALQIKAWKRPAFAPAELVESGGHNVALAERRVFPLPFILRHYPIRSSAHGRRKVHAERLARFAAEERAGGWHIQYDDLAGEDASFLSDPAALTAWDGMAVRAALLADALDHVLLVTALRGIDLAEPVIEPAALAGYLERHGAAAASAPEGQSLLNAVLAGARQPAPPEVEETAEQIARIAAAHATLAGDMVLARRLREVVAELSGA